MSFEVGDIVVCIDAEPGPLWEKYSQWPTEGHRYTVREVTHGWSVTRGIKVPAVVVDELRNPHANGVSEWGFEPERFRKLEGPDERLRLAEIRRTPAPAPSPTHA
jgi:hypothetical protein